jgi:uncharacterized membrane protein YqiK
VKRAEKVAHLFDWEWATRLLDRQARAEYKRATATALAEFKRVEAAAWAEYDRARATALAEYKRVEATARAEYDRAKAAARAEYKRVIAPAWATAFIDMHKRGASK